MKNLSYLNKYLYKYRSLLVWGTIFTIISNIFSIAPAPIVRHSFDLIEEAINVYFLHAGFEEQSRFYGIFLTSVLLYGVLIVFMAVLRGVFLFYVRQTLIIMSRHIEYDLKNEIYDHYQQMPLSFYRRNNTGDLIARISEDVSNVRMYLGPAIMYGINLMTLFVMAVAVMFTIDITLSIYTLLPLPFLSVSIYYVSHNINVQSTRIQQQLGALSTSVQEAFSGIRVIKAFAREEDSIHKFTAESDKYRDQAIKLARTQSLFYPLMLGLIGLSNILVVYIGGLQVMNGSITAGVIAEFIIYLNMLTWPVTSIGWITSLIQRAEASQARINEFLQTKTEITSAKNIVRDIAGNIRLENVHLVYPDTDVEALHGVSFSIEAGQSLAILGTTGAGKTTIANLLTRMYDASAGQVLIDDLDIKDYDIQKLRAQIGYVPQDVFLFSDSIYNNVTFGIATATEDEVIQAVKDADLYQNIIDFPDKFETKIGERGISLSGGQKQRLSIARAIIRNPKILILDDSLSAVDTNTENKILQNLKRIMQNRTTVIISHRVSSVKLANKILVLDEGRIVEQGTHESLLEKGGVYKELYEKQLQTEEA